MSSWICDKCGATYIDVSHQEPSVLREKLELRKVKQQLAIAIEALEKYAAIKRLIFKSKDGTEIEFKVGSDVCSIAAQALQQIKEVGNEISAL